MRILRLFLIPLVLVACTERQPAAPEIQAVPELNASSDWIEFTVDVDWTLYVECLDEDVHGIGQSLVRRHTVTNGNDTRWTMLVRPVTFQLEGMTTGHIWLPVPGTHTVSMRDPASTDFWHLAERFVFENQTTGQVLDWSWKMQLVTNANGEVKVNKVVSEKCSLRH